MYFQFSSDKYYFQKQCHYGVFALEKERLFYRMTKKTSENGKPLKPFIGITGIPGTVHLGEGKRVNGKIRDRNLGNCCPYAKGLYYQR